MSELQPLTDLTEEVQNTIGLLRSMPTPLYLEYIRDTVIFPMIKRWGFEERFHVEQQMPKAQKQVFDHLSQELKGKGKGRILALVGPRGLGKTTLAAQIALTEAWHIYRNSIREDGTQPAPQKYVIYKKAVALIARFKSLYSDYGSVETERLLDSLDYLCREQEILVIDELHDCEDQKMKTRVLTDLIDRRYAALRDTILISNQTASEFSETIGDSIHSRLNEHGAIIACSWPSFR